MNRPPTKRRGRDGQARSGERIQHVCLAWIEGASGDAIDGLARTLDLSPGGAGLVLSRELPVKSRVVVELLLPGPLRLHASGEVTHCIALADAQFRVGVRFFAPPVLGGGTPSQTSAEEI